MSVISFEPLWKTMKMRGISQYKLLKDYHFSAGQLNRLRNNHNVNTYTIDQLCKILDCKSKTLPSIGKRKLRTLKINLTDFRRFLKSTTFSKSA